MTEDQLIKEFFVPASVHADVVLGIGDDGAILDVPSGHQLVTSVDTLLEDVHFPSNFSPKDLASRAVAVCVSDLAAMGAQPKWLTLAISLPAIDKLWLQEFSQSLHKHCSKYGMQLVGGDTVKGNLALSINVMGVVKSGQALRRDTAQAGDLVYVSGSLGGASLALQKLLAKTEIDADLLSRFTNPQARVILGRGLVEIANSCMDVSDGVLLDAARLAKASHIGIEIELEKLPLHPELHNYEFSEALKFATGGDDYELLFTIAPDNFDKLSTLSRQLNITITQIGKVSSISGLHTFYNSDPFVVERTGYQHFSENG